MLFVALAISFFTSLAPTKTALILTLTSVAMAPMVYSASGSLFYVAALVISFSSGLMILVCYSATLSGQEKSKSPSYIALSISAMSLTFSLDTSEDLSMESAAICMSSSLSVLLMMVLLIVCMKTINTCISEKSSPMKKTF